MELNSTQEAAAGDSPGNSMVPAESGQHASTPTAVAPVVAEKTTAVTPVVEDKKTTIQLFTSTTIRLTSRKHGNDTYNDVINRDLDSLGCPSAEDIIAKDIAKSKAGQ